ncbi:hypothetical protein BCBBV1cgp10 [Bacillus phage BCASJ1c]|uniref:10 n=1 Tax=Bacillus phage BCASJ1c TaxID=294382 RepID=Q5YAA0_9CAUD|nr:hypothetical protein BCBBV1cgp10 [Bacillus phage BCASJ1c]AAU85057.1 10 [Bacillus phage BCASJ1c]
MHITKMERRRLKMEFQVGDWVRINHYGNEWTTKVKEVRGRTVIKPEYDIHVSAGSWYHISRVRKATKEEIESTFPRRHHMNNKATLILDRTETSVILDALRFARKEYEPGIIDMVSKKVKPGVISLDGGELKTIYETLFLKGYWCSQQNWTKVTREIWDIGNDVLAVRQAFHKQWEKQLLGRR